MQEPDASVFRSRAKKFGIRFVRQHSRRARNAHCAAGSAAPDVPGIGTAHNRYVQTPALADGLTTAKSARRLRDAPTGFSDHRRGIRRGVVGGTPKKAKIILFWYCIFEIRVVEYKTRLGF